MPPSIVELVVRLAHGVERDNLGFFIPQSFEHAEQLRPGAMDGFESRGWFGYQFDLFFHHAYGSG